MSDKLGSSSSSGSDSDSYSSYSSYSSSSSDSETSEIPKIVRNSEYDDEFSEHPNFDGWNEAQDTNKPKLESTNIDDRTGNKRVAEILNKLGWGESRKSLSLPVRGGLTSDNHHFGPGYRKGLVTDVARYAFDLYRNETTDQIANRLKKKWGPKSDSSDDKKMPAKKKGSTKKKPKLTEKEKHFARIAYHKREKKRKKKQSAKKKGGKRKRRKTRRKRKRRKTKRKRKKSRKRKTRRRKR